MAARLHLHGFPATVDHLPQPARLPGSTGGVLFDACNVLYDDTVWRRWVLKLLSHLGLQTSYLCFFRVWERDYLDEVHRGDRDFCEAFAAFLRSAGLSSGQIDEVQAACQGRRRELEAGARPLPGVKSTLGQLKRSGTILGVVSNTEHSSSTIADHLTRLALGRMFATIVSSIDLKRTMPDAVCYRTAIAAMGLPAEQVAFVGHDSGQLAGAAAVGMPTIALNFDPDARADIYLTRFDELPAAVGEKSPIAAAG